MDHRLREIELSTNNREYRKLYNDVTTGDSEQNPLNYTY